MSDFPAKAKRTDWSVWRGSKWLGEWSGEPRVGWSIKPRECLRIKKIESIDKEAGRIYVK